MELRKHFSYRKFFVITYLVIFMAYFAIGLSPADATFYDVSGRLVIPSIALDSDVTTVQLENHTLPTPDTIVGSFSENDTNTFLFGHVDSVFKDLNQVKLNQPIYYNGKIYVITKIDMVKKAVVNMNKVLEEQPKDTIVIMTCAGTDLGGGDYSHRLLVTAVSN